MGFYSDSAVLETYPSAEGLDAEQLKQAAKDMAEVYEHVHRNPDVAEAKLRNWGEGQGIDPDRMTRALALLQDAGKVFHLPSRGALADLVAAPVAEAEAQPKRTKGAKK